MPAISDAEWAVMRAVWERSPITTSEVVAAVAAVRGWKPKTVHTLLRRLIDKGALSFEKAGREYAYTPLVGERECQMAESRTFLSRVFGVDEVAPFLAAFVEREQLNAEEIEELKRILDGGR